jgi:glycosyltransferase involved in cell wall biosynthesis
MPEAWRTSSALPSVSIVIPTRNEAENLPWVMHRLPAGTHEVIVVDGDSTDGTPEVARRLRPSVRVISQPLPGKGAAIAAGLLAATGDVVVMLDADGSMDPAEIPALVGSLMAGFDVVKGSRYHCGGGSTDLNLIRSAGNRALRLLARITTGGQRWTELCYGYAAFRTSAIDALRLADVLEGKERRSWPTYGHGFEIEALLFLRAAHAGLRVTEVASMELPRRAGESNLHPWRDGWRILRTMLIEWSVRRRTRERLQQIALPDPYPLAAESAS